MFNQLTAVSRLHAKTFRHIARYLLAGMMLGAVLGASAQTAEDPDLFRISGKLWKEEGRKAGSVDQDLLRSALQYLQRTEANERRIKNKLAKKDSALAAALFNDAAGRYASLQKMLGSGEQTVSGLHTSYIARLDTLRTAFAFLSGETQRKQSIQVQKEIGDVAGKIGKLQNRFNQADQVKKFTEQRRQFLVQQLNKVGLVKEVKKMQKQGYYYQAQLQRYKTMFDNPSRFESAAVQLLKNLPRFNLFFQKHSLLAGMFRLPGGNEAGTLTDPAGLQTRDAVVQNLVQRTGSPALVQQMLQQQLQGAQPAMEQLKDKLLKPAGGSDEQLPHFKPNNQKTKRFAERLEIGSSLQTVKANRFFPSATDVALSIGYKLNDKSTVGVGSSYRMGWGRDIRHMSITHQGAGIRSFADYKVKGNIWLSGGAEMNYRSRFNSFEVLKNYSAWQQSALLGISKKYRIRGKLNGNVQLLYDFLWRRQAPRTQPLVFRIGTALR